MRQPQPRPRVTIEHALGQYSVRNGELYELFEVVSTLSGEWTLDHEWRPCRT